MSFRESPVPLRATARRNIAWAGSAASRSAPGFVPGNFQDICADGTVFVGSSVPNEFQRAIIWNLQGGTRTELEELASRGLELPADIELPYGDFQSDDGRIIAGNYLGESEGFRRAVLLD